jgi:PhnB protein
MSQPAVKPIPDGMHSLTPHLVCAGAADAVAFYVKAFNAVELSRLPGPDGKLMHAMVRIGDSMLMLNDEFPEHGMVGAKALKGSPVTVHLYVENADATFAQAVAAGATVRMPPADMFWGDRYAQVEDPFGHRWSIATHIRDVKPEDYGQAMRASPPGCTETESERA